MKKKIHFNRTYGRFVQLLFLISITVSLSGCAVYKQNLMFKSDEMSTAFAKKVEETEHNYKVQPNDYLMVDVYTNGGELLIDPNFQYSGDMGQSRFQQEKPKYLVRVDGKVDLPMIGEVEVDGLTIVELNVLLSSKYNEFYENSFVYAQLVNQRVIIIGPEGGKVIPLLNENMNLIEVIALYGGMGKDSKSNSIKILRGDLNDPEIFAIDLSTIEGMKKSQLKIEANDIIYIEPGRKILSESLRDITPIVSLTTSVLTLVILLTNITR